MIIPCGINGYELVQQATRLYPDIKVLLTSGFAVKAIVENETKKFSEHLLGKPYQKVNLAH